MRSERLHGGDIRFKPGYDLDSWRHLGAEPGWDSSPLRALHVCFLERSSADPATTWRPDVRTSPRRECTAAERLAPWSGLLGASPDVACAPATQLLGKRRNIARGDRVTVDTENFVR